MSEVAFSAGFRRVSTELSSVVVIRVVPVMGEVPAERPVRV